MARPKAIPVYLYSLNARTRSGVIQYAHLFERVASEGVSRTVREVSRELNYALDISRNHDEVGQSQVVFTGTVVAGSAESVPLFFDYTTGKTEVGETPAGKWLAQQSRVYISVSQSHRYVALEGGRNGVTAVRLGHYFGLLAESLLGLQSAEVDIIPVQSESLRDEIESFERIRQATAIVSRPNFDWSDFSDKLSDLAEESVGHEAEATVTAARGEGLSKRRGIVHTILGGIGTGSAAIRDFRVTGRKPNADRDTTISSKKHQKRSFARPPRPGASTEEVDEVVFGQAATLVADELPPVEEQAAGTAAASNVEDDPPSDDPQEQPIGKTDG